MIMSLIEKAEAAIDQEQAAEMQEKAQKKWILTLMTISPVWNR